LYKSFFFPIALIYVGGYMYLLIQFFDRSSAYRARKLLEKRAELKEIAGVDLGSDNSDDELPVRIFFLPLF
jgi:hypothetical protein